MCVDIYAEECVQMHSPPAVLFACVHTDLLLLCVCVGLSTLLPLSFPDSQETAAFFVHPAPQDVISAVSQLDEELYKL